MLLDSMVGEDDFEIVDFKTAVNVVPAHRTQETNAGESGGTSKYNGFASNNDSCKEVNVGAPPAN